MRQHYAAKERHQPVEAVKRHDIGDILVRADDHNSTVATINAAQIENIRAVFKIGTERLLIIRQAKCPFRRPKKCRQVVHVDLAEALLQDGPDIDDGINVRIRGRMSYER